MLEPFDIMTGKHVAGNNTTGNNIAPSGNRIGNSIATTTGGHLRNGNSNGLVTANSTTNSDEPGNLPESPGSELPNNGHMARHTSVSSDKSSTSPTSSGRRKRIPYPPPKILSGMYSGEKTPIGTSLSNLNNVDCSTSVSTTLSEESEESLAKQDFMVSFMVDARGGKMVGCRHNGVKMTFPAKTVPQPMRITCRYVKQENLLYPPTLNEGEELASRILQVGPVGSKFLGSVLIEIPHVASLRRGERETSILRCDSAPGGKWIEHRQCSVSERILKESTVAVIENVSSSMSSLTSSVSRANDNANGGEKKTVYPSAHLHHVGIVTEDFPQYFAIVSRSKQEVINVGSVGAILSPALMPRVKIHIPPKALNREVEIGISAQHIEDDIVEEILVQGGAVSPIVTIEPRRRKFHKAITVTIPLPERIPGRYNNGRRSTSADRGSLGSSRKTSMESLNKTLTGITSLTPPPPGGSILPGQDPTDGSAYPNAPIETTLKLVCSMSGNHHKACWEDVTDTTPLTFTSGGIQFTSVVSASFWAIDCPKWMSSDVMTLVDQLYKSAMRVPYLARFYLYAKRHTAQDVTLRILCLTEPDRAENPLELQEDFKELCRSDYLEIFDKTEITIKFSGNLARADSDANERHMEFKPFSENRIGFNLRRRNDKNPYVKGRVNFMIGFDRSLYEAKVDLTKYLQVSSSSQAVLHK